MDDLVKAFSSSPPSRAPTPGFPAWKGLISSTFADGVHFNFDPISNSLVTPFLPTWVTDLPGLGRATPVPTRPVCRTRFGAELNPR